ncbi:hypothetical protein [Microvirga guangxiensis]|uniref:Uncharacterized protein n=1 Tax=Microvirga guangxiensis TaxID=549386 RepID=A0A1G5F1V5_9HYPH|nr:hypothetical protein [Microvirga guangxiensis]SCY32608.1 hypothetical protein SAMN02927923_01168 [Microvirga guangxiensis]
MSGRRTGQVLLMVAGLIAWAVQFTIIYAVTSTLCGRGWADAAFLGFEIVPMTIVSATLVTFSATLLAAVWSFRNHRRKGEQPVSGADSFMNHVATLINGLSLVIILWHGISAFILPACA